MVAGNGEVFIKKGEFGTRQPVTGAGLVPKFSYCLLLHSIPSAGINVK